MAVKFEELNESKLIIDEIYCGGMEPNMSAEVLSKLMLCSNLGGFRQVKDKNRKLCLLCLIYDRRRY